MVLYFQIISFSNLKNSSDEAFNTLKCLQERALALAEGRSPPGLSGSTDIRPLSMEDFIYAHKQVKVFFAFPHSVFHYKALW